MDNDHELLLPSQNLKFLKNGGNARDNYGSFGPTVSNDEAITTLDIVTPPASEPIGTDSLLTPPAATLSIIGLSHIIKEKPGHWWNGSCFRSARKRIILQNLCMTFNCGELTALVGSSGSGKTTLLDTISGRTEGEVTGVVSYKDEPCTREMMKQRSSYVLQADRLLPTLTVRETLTFMAYLKLPNYLKAAEINSKVQSVIADMGLRHVEDSRIGGAVVRGVSGGEKRRITIGVQLLKDPEILLLDEPTSGLDAFTARHLVANLAELAHKGKLIIMSIHQPRSDIFNILDKIAILTLGRLAFLGQPNQLVPYFTKIGYPCPRDKNPCDIYTDLTSVDRRTPSREKSTTKTAQKLCNAFANSDLQARVVKHITLGLHNHYNDPTDLAAHKRDATPSLLRTYKCLLTRMNVHLWRDRGAFMGRLLFLPFFVPFILMFLGRLGDNQGSIQDRLGLIYQALQVCPYMGLTNAIALFPVLREIFYRECHDGLYSVPTFLLAFFVHCLPLNTITAALFSSILYWAAGMNDDPLAFGAFLLVNVILIHFGEMMTVAVLGIFRNSQLANNTTALIFSASGMLASGLLRSIENMPQFLQWAGYIAVHKYSTEIVVANEFHNLTFKCNPGQPCLTRGDEYLRQSYPGATDHETRNFALLGGYSVAIFILAVMTFKTRGIPTLH